MFEIVAHRGVAGDAPENTIEAFQRAIDLGADGIELDVRLSADQVPVVYHYYQLQENTSLSGAIFKYTWEELRKAKVFPKQNVRAKASCIPLLLEVLEMFAGKIGLEIHLQGPEPESAQITGALLNKFQEFWEGIEVTSYHPAMLLAMQRECPGLAVDLLFPRSESWMTPEIVQYQAVHYARLAEARAVHLHPSQLSHAIISELKEHGIEVHAWDVNEKKSLEIVTKFGIPRICTDKFEKAFLYREKLEKVE
jgi:glycerophosphoryl diester phosphodiesterase